MATMRTRFAPSPTGPLHVGGARTAVWNWLLARRYGGSFVLRIEDTDTERNVPGAEEALLEDLRWLGLDWDEGPDVGGPFGPYRQSQRLALYREAADHLLAKGAAYWCHCPPRGDEDSPRPRCPCADRALGPTPGASLRFRVPPGPPVAVEDRVRGRVEFPRPAIEDFVLLRADGRPTYNFAAVVDDAAMRITLVLRGVEHLANTPKQILLFEALGERPPAFAHVPLVLGPDRKKLSKRHGATAVRAFAAEGILPEALVNYLCLLGWSSPSGEEVRTPAELQREFDLDRVGTTDTVFDVAKLRWLSAQHLKRLPDEEFRRRARAFADPAAFGLDEEGWAIALAAVRERLHTLGELPEALAPFAGPRTEEEHRRRAEVFADPAARAVLEAAAVEAETWAERSLEGARAFLRRVGERSGARGRALYHPLRVALTGRDEGPELVALLAALGPERLRQRLRAPAPV